MRLGLALGCVLYFPGCVDRSDSARVSVPPSDQVASASAASPVSAAPLDTAEPDPEPGPETDPGPEFWEGEAEWARSRFPELATFRSSVDFAPLLEWVPADGTAQLFITVVDEKHGYRCASATATRVHENYINMLIPGPPRVENGQTVRSFVAAGASPHGVDLNYVFGTQKRSADGTWEDLVVFGTTGHDYGGWVGPIVGDTAHFLYRRVDIAASCGPMVNVPCENGLPRECNLCENVTLDVQFVMGSMSNRPRKIQPPQMRCLPACPDPPHPELTKAELDRVGRFVSHFNRKGWALDDSSLVALYRTLAACRSDPLFKQRKAGVP
jgi:hypothetical protein